MSRPRADYSLRQNPVFRRFRCYNPPIRGNAPRTGGTFTGMPLA